MIDAGAFHNDVVAVANKNVFFYHAQAFQDPATLQKDLQALAPDIELHFIEVSADEVPIGDAVKSYLFNSQLISVPGDGGRGFKGLAAGELCRPGGLVERLAAINKQMKPVAAIVIAKAAVVGRPLVPEMHPARQRRVMGEQIFIGENGL